MHGAAFRAGPLHGFIFWYFDLSYRGVLLDKVTLFLMALGLSMDAFAVSISNAMCYSDLSRRQTLAASASFGVFQGVMPIIGYFAGRLLHEWIEAVDHWVALALLGFIGGKMLVEGIRDMRRKAEVCETKQRYSVKGMLLQAVATSIDALAVGISLATLSTGILAPAAFIAGITFIVCLIGAELGRQFGKLLGDWAQVIGGLILIGIGLKIFIEHMLESGAAG